MKSDVICPLCNNVLGRVHGYQEELLRMEHIKEKHPVVYQEISNIYVETDRIWKVYKVHARELFYYKPLKKEQ